MNDDFDKTIQSGRNYSTESIFATLPPSLKIGEKLCNERYIVKELLGEGAMGKVYLCTDTFTKVDVAIKVVPPHLSRNQDALDDILYNFQLVQGLRHTNIAALKTLEPDTSRNNDYLLVMEYVKGRSLQSEILKRRKERKPFTYEEVCQIVTQIASALDYAHENKIIHRDIKPGNIMLSENNKVSVLDFGLAAKIRTTLTTMSVQIDNSSGTPAYKAPEQWKATRPKAATDQYALAVIAYELLSGALPFESDDTGILRESVIHEAPERPDDISDEVWAALQKGLAKKAEERFANCSEFAKALSGKCETEKEPEPIPEKKPEVKTAETFEFSETAEKIKDENIQEPKTIKSAIRKSYQGRSSRKEYWMYQLRWWLCVLVLTSIAEYFCMDIDDYYLVFMVSFLCCTGGLVILTFFSWTGLAIRRLHDSGRNGSWLWLILIPVLGWFPLIWALCEKPDAGKNYFGSAKALSFRKLYAPWISGCLLIIFILLPSTRLFGLSVLANTGLIDSVTIPYGIRVVPREIFSGCEKLQTVIIPDSVTKIGWDAFLGCSGLERITIPDSVTKIGWDAFSGCTGLKKITTPNYYRFLEEIKSFKNLEELTITGGLTCVKRDTFSGLDKLKKINIGDGLKIIEDYAFIDVPNLEEVILPNGVTYMGVRAFSGLKNLKKINIPTGLTVINDYTFNNCTSLQEITIPVGVTRIGSNAFSNCYSLERVTFPDSVNTLDWYAFANCKKLTEVKIPGVTRMGAGAFNSCDNLRRIYIPKECDFEYEYSSYPQRGTCRVIRSY